MSKRALFVVTSHNQLGATGKVTGWYLPEVSHVYWPLVEAGFTVDFVSPQGGDAPMDPSSRKLDDPQNKRFVEEVADRLRTTFRPDQVDAADCDVIFFAGGHGTMWDLWASPALDALTAAIWEQGGVVSAVCHGQAGLVNVKLSNGKFLVDGRALTAFSDAEERAVKLGSVVPFLLESRLRERGGNVTPGGLWSNTVIRDGKLVTGQNPQSAAGVAREIQVAAAL